MALYQQSVKNRVEESRILLQWRLKRKTASFPAKEVGGPGPCVPGCFWSGLKDPPLPGTGPNSTGFPTPLPMPSCPATYVQLLSVCLLVLDTLTYFLGPDICGGQPADQGPPYLCQRRHADV